MSSETTAQPTTSWQVQIHIVRKAAVVDPQGNTIRDALHQLHFATVHDVRMGKYLEITLDAVDEATARQQVESMCATLLANPVIEQYTFTIFPIAELNTSS